MYRIGIDAKRYFYNSTGLGKYATNLLRCLHPPYVNENIKLILYTPKRPKGFEENISFNRTRIATPRLPIPFWRSFGMLSDINKDSLDLFHGISHEIPFEITDRFQCPSIVTVHDLIFVRFPELFPLIDRTFYQLKYKTSVKRANGIIAVGEQTKLDLIQFWNIPAQKIQIIHQSIDPIYFDTYRTFLENKSVCEKTRIHPKDFILMVGTISKRKNMMLTLQSYAANKNLHKEFNLVIVGNSFGINVAYKKECEEFIRRNNLSQKVFILTRVSDQELLHYYLQARAFVYPSFFEGFGLPVVEAMALGCVTLLSKGSGLQDAGHEHSLRVDPNNPEELSVILEKACYEESLRKLQIQLGLEHAQKFHPQQIAPILWSYYKTFLPNTSSH